MIDRNSKAKNAKHIACTYKAGDQVLLRQGTKNKYESPYQGPFCILQVNDNGTVQLKMGAVEDTINIQRIIPYIELDASNHEENAVCSLT